MIEVLNRNSLIKKTLGLYDKTNKAIYFQTRFGIHTFFMKNDIQVIILDDENYVVKNKIVKPNSIFFWNPKYKDVIEKNIKSSNDKIDCNIGEKLLFKIV